MPLKPEFFSGFILSNAKLSRELRWSFICLKEIYHPTFFFRKILTFFRTVGGMRQVQMSCDIFTCFAQYKYSRKQRTLDNKDSIKWEIGVM